MRNPSTRIVITFDLDTNTGVINMTEMLPCTNQHCPADFHTETTTDLLDASIKMSQWSKLFLAHAPVVMDKKQ